MEHKGLEILTNMDLKGLIKELGEQKMIEVVTTLVSRECRDMNIEELYDLLVTKE